jgi:hypothetical protein
MKSLYLCCLLLLCQWCMAQSPIVKVEYFIDTDPGIDNAISVPITSGTDVNVTFSFPINSLADGFHILSSRAKNADGLWSSTTFRLFLKKSFAPISPPSPVQPQIVSMEYFIDADPGFNNGVSVPITSGTDVNATFNFPINTLPDGFHILSSRAKNADGFWGSTTFRLFLKKSFAPIPPPIALQKKIIAMEYFIDADPGIGNGISIPVSASDSLQNVVMNVNLNNVANGLHYLSVRTKNQDNQWSVTSIDKITKKDNIVTIGNSLASFCRATTFAVPVTVSGTFSPTNVFTLQLSNSSGSFASPTVLGTLSGNVSGTINAIIPAGTSIGKGYKLRIVASNPADNQQPIRFFEITALCQCLLNASLATGNWGTSGIWSCGHIPLATEPVQISSGHTVTLDVNGAAKSLDLRGILNKQATKVLLIQGN